MEAPRPFFPSHPSRPQLRSFVRLTPYAIGMLAALQGLHSHAATSAPAAGNPRALEEVNVYSKYTTNDRLDTATGLGLTLQETPQSVSVMTVERILDQNLTSLTDVVRNAAGISAKGLDSTRHTFSARGFAIDNYQIDGVPIYWSSGGDAGETQTDTALFERIEVVRGATGLLTGAGNPSASINLVRKHADSRDFTGRLQLSAGSWDSYGASADLATGLNASGSIRGRAVVSYEDSNAFRDLAGDRRHVLYGVIGADLTERTLLQVGASYQKNDPTASTWGGLPTWYSDGSRTDWGRSKTTAAGWTAWASEVENQFADLIHTFANGWEAKFSINRNINKADLDLLYLSGAPDRDTGMGMSVSPYRADTEREQISYSIQLSGSYSLFGRSHELTLGAIQSEQEETADSAAFTNAAPVGNFLAWNGIYPQPTWGARSVVVDTRTEQTGIYAATRLAVTDAFKVILGGRVADWEETGSSYGTAIDYGDHGVVIPYAGAVYNVTENHNLYASYTEIFRPQNNQDRTGSFLDPVTGKSYELGLKSRFFDDALHATVAVFNIQQDNLAQPDVGHLVPGTIFQAYRAAEGTESEGFEIELVGEVMPGWDVSFSYTKFDAEDAEGVAVNTSQPREMLKLYTTYRFDGALRNLTLAGGVVWEDANYTDTLNPVTGAPERLEQESFSLVSLMARYDLTANLTAQLNIENLFDKTYYNQIGFYNQLEYGEPRNVTATLRYSF